ncbi:MAG: hypothetical protein ACLPWF_15035 [Bryobacteraceae bacterium]
MKKLLITALLLSPAIVWAQPTIAPPQLGFVQDSGRGLRPAFGVSGSFILGPSVTPANAAGQIVTEAFSGSLGLLKTDSSLTAFNSQGKVLTSIIAAPGPALFAFSPSGATALAYIASTKALIEWRGSAFAPVSFSCDQIGADTVLAIAFPSPFEATLMVQRNAGLWEVHVPLGAAGALSQTALPGVHAPLLALPSGDLVYSDAAGIVVRRPDASEVHITASLPASFSLQQMNQDWVQLTDLASSARFAIHATPGREGFYRLPESGQ